MTLLDVDLSGTSSVSGEDLSASILFEQGDGLDGNSTDLLKITLTNTSLADVTLQPDVMTALFFDINAVLAPVSAILSGGSVVLFGPDGGGNVGGEWAYGGALVGAPLGAAHGISSAGFGLFGTANFGGPNLHDPLGVDGLNYGITSAGDDPATGQAAVTGSNPLIQNSVMFLLSGLDGVGGPIIIDNLGVQYGTALAPDDPILVPEPYTLSLLVLGLVGLGVIGTRRRTA